MARISTPTPRHTTSICQQRDQAFPQLSCANFFLRRRHTRHVLRLSEPGDGLDKPGLKGMRRDGRQVHSWKYRNFNEVLDDWACVRFQTRTSRLSLSTKNVNRRTGIHLVFSQSIKGNTDGDLIYVLKHCFRGVHKIVKSYCWLLSRLSIRKHGTTRLLLDGFSWNLIFEYF